jgi:hypothetical protein
MPLVAAEMMCHDLLGGYHVGESVRAYLANERGISRETLKLAQVGIEPGREMPSEWRIVIPVAVKPKGSRPLIVGAKYFGLDVPVVEGWAKDRNGKKVARNGGPAALYDPTCLARRRPDLSGPVLLCEGEIDALSALSHGYHAMTGTGGAATWKDSWTRRLAAHPLAQEHGVVVAYDGDTAGREGAQKVARALSITDLDVCVATLPEGKDVNDVVVGGGTDALAHLIEEAKPFTAPSAPVTIGAPTPSGSSGALERVPGDGVSYVPFPLETLPGPVQDFVTASAKAVMAPPAMVAVPALCVMAGAVGSAARLRLKRTWREASSLWAAVVAPSGSTKSPAFAQATRVLTDIEHKARDAYESSLKKWREAGEEGPEPVRSRFRISDPTPEAVVKLLRSNERVRDDASLTLTRDELAGWIGSFDRYANGSADLQFWIEVWGGTQVSRDRVGDGNTTVHYPSCSITGTIQPRTLLDKLGQVHFETGFAARLMLVMPPPMPKTWTEADVTQEVRDAYARLVRTMYAAPSDTEVGLTPAAKKLWVAFYDEANAAMRLLPEGPCRAVAAKGVTHVARLALVLHLAHKAAGETRGDDVSETVMRRAIQLGTWLRDETLRVYHALGIEARAVSPTDRFLHALPDDFRTAKALEIADEHGIPQRTAEKWLADLCGNAMLQKVKRGHYRKLDV